MKKIVALTVACTLMVVGCTQSPNDFYWKAVALEKANEASRAERVFREGILTHPQDTQLTYGLMSLYLRTKQWDKLSSYLAVAPTAGGYNERYQPYWALGQRAFDSQKFLDAYNFFFQAGLNMDAGFSPDQNTRCNNNTQGALAYSNAAAAAHNMNDISRVRQAIEGINAEINKTNCQDDGDEEMRKELVAAQGYIPQ